MKRENAPLLTAARCCSALASCSAVRCVSLAWRFTSARCSRKELPQQEQERGFDNLQQRNAGAGALSCPVAAYRSCPGQPPCGANGFSQSFSTRRTDSASSGRARQVPSRRAESDVLGACAWQLSCQGAFLAQSSVSRHPFSLSAATSATSCLLISKALWPLVSWHKRHPNKITMHLVRLTTAVWMRRPS